MYAILSNTHKKQVLVFFLISPDLNYFLNTPSFHAPDPNAVYIIQYQVKVQIIPK